MPPDPADFLEGLTGGLSPEIVSAVNMREANEGSEACLFRNAAFVKLSGSFPAAAVRIVAAEALGQEEQARAVQGILRRET
ncbi:hypothetical protein [Roseibium sp. M-1]